MTIANLQKLLVATNNSGKIHELQLMLETSPFQIIGLASLPGIVEVDETGHTFAENASLKASGYATQAGMLSIADDSGLEVAALDNRPGVLSARYGSEGSSFAEKMSLILEELTASGSGDRRARFVCAMAVADENGKILSSAEGICSGVIAQAPRGTGGFGYDPIFVPDGFDRTFGELSTDVKQKISHRFRAFEQIIPFLRHFDAV